MACTNSDQLWNDDVHDIEKAAAYLSGTNINTADLLSDVRLDIETHWPMLVRFADALLQRCRPLR